jgi:hypothetical protein
MKFLSYIFIYQNKKGETVHMIISLYDFLCGLF